WQLFSLLLVSAPSAICALSAFDVFPASSAFSARSVLSVLNSFLFQRASPSFCCLRFSSPTPLPLNKRRPHAPISALTATFIPATTRFRSCAKPSLSRATGSARLPAKEQTHGLASAHSYALRVSVFWFFTAALSHVNWKRSKILDRRAKMILLRLPMPPNGRVFLP